MIIKVFLESRRAVTVMVDPKLFALDRLLKKLVPGVECTAAYDDSSGGILEVKRGEDEFVIHHRAIMVPDVWALSQDKRAPGWRQFIQTIYTTPDARERVIEDVLGLLDVDLEGWQQKVDVS